MRAEGQEPGGVAPENGGALGDFAEELGTFLGNTERKASEWLAQRKKVTDQLTAIRDKATILLQQMGAVVAERPLARRRGPKPRSPQAEGSVRAPAGGRRPGRPKKTRRKPMSDEARARIAEAQRKRWAAFRKAKG